MRASIQTRSALSRVAPGALATLVACALLTLAPSAEAATVTDDRPLLFSFDGADSSLGPFNAILAIAIDEESGDLYAINAEEGTGKGPEPGKGPGPFDAGRVICRFDAEGTAKAFTGGDSAGESCLDGIELPGKATPFGVEGGFTQGAFRADVAIDNSGGAGGSGEGEQGRLYVSEESGAIHAFEASGAWLWTLATSTSLRPCGIAVDPDGRLWVGNGQAGGSTGERLLEFNTTGKAPPSSTPSDEVVLTNGTKRGCRLGIDQSGGDIYTSLIGPQPATDAKVERYRAGLYDSTLFTGRVLDLTADQSVPGGHVFASTESAFRELVPCAPAKCALSQVAGSPFGGDLIGTARGIAYHPALDRVYVTDNASSTVKAFGPKASGTAPDVGNCTVDAIGLHDATAQCEINPLGLANAYRFEWKAGAGGGWGAAKMQPRPYPSVTADSSPHQVSFVLPDLTANRDYQVRLAGISAANDLTSYSAPASFKTLPPPAPEVEDCEASAATVSSLQLDCAIETFEEPTGWRAERSTGAGCQGSFSGEPLQQIGAGQTEPTAVQWEYQGLLPAQTYCLRIFAEGPGGTDTGAVVEATTLAVPPDDASIAFAAPRTDTTARINARVNPRGEADLAYRFEVSEDGADWTPRGELVSALDSRDPIVIADELTGLSPSTTYHYRLAEASNSAGQAPGLPTAAGTFTTRSAAEARLTDPPSCSNEAVRRAQRSHGYLGSCRGIELVNSPDKGNQNAIGAGPRNGAPPISADGRVALWATTAGTPGAHNGTINSFLAERGGDGWGSEPAAPPAAEQLGGGSYSYRLLATTPDFETLFFNAALETALAQPEPVTVVRGERGGSQEVLREYATRPINRVYERLLRISDDGRQVVFPNLDTRQVEEIGHPSTGPELLSVMPDGQPSACGLDVSEGKGFGKNLQTRPGYEWIATTDASRVYFQAKPNQAGDPGACDSPKPPGLYLRDREAGQTIAIDQPSSGGAPEFIRAGADGKQAFFITSSVLDPDDANAGRDVYRWDEDAGSAGESECLTCVVAQAGVGSFAMVSDDFSHVYFESTRRLLPGASEGTGKTNVYALSGGQLRLVGAVVEGNVLSVSADAVLSADGETLLFRAQATRTLSSDAPEGCASSCQRLYLYHDNEGSVECISCAHGSPPPIGATQGGSAFFQLSADGSTAAFTTPAALVGRDVNADTDVYEWRSGSAALITDGVTDFQTELTAPRVLGIDRDGSDVLFAIVPPGGSLTGYEQDELLNLYDARIGGGFMPPITKAECEGDACQGPLTPAPSPRLPASAGFAGRGNLAEAPPRRRCAKGKRRVRRGGKARCVKRKAAKAKRKKRNANANKGRSR